MMTSMPRMKPRAIRRPMLSPSRIVNAVRAVVVATGGKSIPKMGATGLGYQIAGQFGLPVVEAMAACVLADAFLRHRAQVG